MIDAEFEYRGFNPYELRGSIREIEGIEALDIVMKECDAALEVSDDELRRLFRTFSYKFDYSMMPKNPYSPEYRDFQFRCYEEIARKKLCRRTRAFKFSGREKICDDTFPILYKELSDCL